MIVREISLGKICLTVCLLMMMFKLYTDIQKATKTVKSDHIRTHSLFYMKQPRPLIRNNI